MSIMNHFPRPVDTGISESRLGTRKRRKSGVTSMRVYAVVRVLVVVVVVRVARGLGARHCRDSGQCNDEGRHGNETSKDRVHGA